MQKIYMMTEEDILPYLRRYWRLDKDKGEFTCKVSHLRRKVGDKLGMDKDGTMCAKFSGKTYPISHLIFLRLTGVKPKRVRHLNGDRYDTRYINIVDASTICNNKLGVWGVKEIPGAMFDKRYQAYHRGYDLGVYDTVEEASAYQCKARSAYVKYVSLIGHDMVKAKTLIEFLVTRDTDEVEEILSSYDAFLILTKGKYNDR